MNFQEYMSLTEEIVSSTERVAPYDDAFYAEYTGLNLKRMKRWLKTMELNPELVKKVESITAPQQWLVISEPWCGDAAHNLPFIHALAEKNPLITLDIELRDAEPFTIQYYLTNGSKSIPKLVVRDENGTDLFVWGPRPAACQELQQRLKAENAPLQELLEQVQQWYNGNKGKDLQEELLGGF